MYVNEKEEIVPVLPDLPYKVSTSSYFKASWKNRINPVEMDVIKPDTLLNRLLKSINGEKDGLTGVIEGQEIEGLIIVCSWRLNQPVRFWSQNIYILHQICKLDELCVWLCLRHIREYSNFPA